MGFILACYYTTGSIYECSAEKLKARAVELGLKCHFKGIDDLGGWCQNTNYKPAFVSECLESFDDDIAYTDADSEIHEYPALFDNPTSDIIIRKQDFAWRKGEWMSGTFFMRNNAMSKSVVSEWNRRVADASTTRNNPYSWEQYHLGQAILSLGAEWSQLPAEYICFDNIEREVGKIKKPVFTHMQYSRKTANKK